MQDTREGWWGAYGEVVRGVLTALVVHGVKVVLRLELEGAGLETGVGGHGCGLEVHDPHHAGFVHDEDVGLDESVTVQDLGPCFKDAPVLGKAFTDGTARAVLDLEGSVEPGDGGTGILLLTGDHLPDLVRACAQTLGYRPQFLAASRDGRLEGKRPVGGGIVYKGKGEVYPRPAGQRLAVLQGFDQPEPPG